MANRPSKVSGTSFSISFEIKAEDILPQGSIYQDRKFKVNRVNTLLFLLTLMNTGMGLMHYFYILATHI